MTGLLEGVPVWRMEHGKPRLLGAVVWYQQNRKE